jgi:hypothetical protein
MRSNCNLYAWRQFLVGNTESLTLHSSSWSKWSSLAKSRAWKYTLRPMGCLVGYAAWLLVQFAWFTQRGQWAHVTTDTSEFVPVEDYRTRWFVPPFFRGEVRAITLRDTCRRCGFRKLRGDTDVNAKDGSKAADEKKSVIGVFR